MALRRAARVFGAVLQQTASAAARGGSAAAPAVAEPRSSRRAWLSHAALQQAPALHTYTLTISTGNLRGAGSLTPAWLQLVGSNGKSERIVVGETEEDSLRRGTVRTVQITTSEDLGQLRFVKVQRLGNSISDAGTGWFLEHISVQTPEHGRLLFPCHSWFGESDSGGTRGPLERNLIPVAPEDMHEGETVQLSASGVAVPHPDKVKLDGPKAKGVNRKGFGYGGEDSYFYCRGRNGVFALGVADGVFMWRELGIDSGDFSRELMRLSAQSVQSGAVDVVRVLHDAASGAARSGVQGSSTACVVLVDQEAGKLFAANLGDSGCLLLRPAPPEAEVEAGPGHEDGAPVPTAAPVPAPGGVVPFIVRFRTNQLEHEFGRPYQLGHHAAADSVDKCDVATQPLRPGDVIVLGTDGLLDNISDQDIAAEVARCRARDDGPSIIAQRLARLAFEAAYDKSRSTPYAMAASEHFDMVYSGGKPDDITVLVAVCD